MARLVTSVFLAMSLGACATTDPLPTWFDAIERLPIRSVTVAGHRIAYLDVGAGPPLILLHGFGGSMWQWEYQQTALSAHVRVITPDLLGSGLSDKPDIEYRPDELLASLTGFMDALQIPQAIVAGHSMGAGIAIGLALDHPDRVSKLILISGLPPHVLENLTSPTIKRALETRAPSWLVSLGNWLFGGLMTERILEEIIYDQTQLTPLVWDRSNRNRRRPGIVTPILSIARQLPIWESRFAPRIGSIAQPTLILWGEEDRVFPLAVGRRLHATIPGSIFVAIPRAGHIPQWEQPALVNRHVLRFAEP